MRKFISKLYFSTRSKFEALPHVQGQASLFRESKESVERVIRLPKRTIKAPSNLVIDEALGDEVILHLRLMKMAKLENPGPPCDVMIDFDLKLIRINPELPKGDPKIMYPLPNA